MNNCRFFDRNLLNWEILAISIVKEKVQFCGVFDPDLWFTCDHKEWYLAQSIFPNKSAENIYTLKKKTYIWN